jgi:hypothetical protein
MTSGKEEQLVHPYHHAQSSVRKWGGKVEDYLPLHQWFDESKAHHADVRHRALRHHAQGIFWAEEVFGPTITNSDGKIVPVRFIGEQHVREDLGWIPSLKDWLQLLPVLSWMRQVATRAESTRAKEPANKRARARNPASARERKPISSRQ